MNTFKNKIDHKGGLHISHKGGLHISHKGGLHIDEYSLDSR